MSDEKKNDGGPAFPTPSVTGLPNGGFEYGQVGMSLRDHFAGLAMQGLMTNKMYDQFSPKEVAERAFTWADLMIKAREQ